jgi:hypothetical protein
MLYLLLYKCLFDLSHTSQDLSYSPHDENPHRRYIYTNLEEVAANGFVYVAELLLLYCD